MTLAWRANLGERPDVRPPVNSTDVGRTA